LNEVIVRVIMLVSNGGLNLLSSSYACPDYEPITNHAGLTSSNGREEIRPRLVFFFRFFLRCLKAQENPFQVTKLKSNLNIRQRQRKKDFKGFRVG